MYHNFVLCKTNFVLQRKQNKKTMLLDLESYLKAVKGSKSCLKMFKKAGKHCHKIFQKVGKSHHKIVKKSSLSCASTHLLALLCAFAVF
jgi:hypothetical protein